MHILGEWYAERRSGQTASLNANKKKLLDDLQGEMITAKDSLHKLSGAGLKKARTLNYKEVQPWVGISDKLTTKFKLIIGESEHPLDGKSFKLQYANKDTLGTDGKPLTPQTAQYLSYVTDWRKTANLHSGFQNNFIETPHGKNNLPAATFKFYKVKDRANTYTLQFDDEKKQWLVFDKDRDYLAASTDYAVDKDGKKPGHVQIWFSQVLDGVYTMNVFEEDGSWRQLCGSVCMNDKSGTYKARQPFLYKDAKYANKTCEETDATKCLKGDSSINYGWYTGLRVRLIDH